MLNSTYYQRIKSCGEFIKSKLGKTPDLAIILGSGLGSLADQIENPIVINYEEIPSFPVSTVEGHEGKLIIGTLEGRTVLCMKGRFHYYEGYSLEDVTLPIRVMNYLGIKSLIVTNAAGGINTSFAKGALMIIKDHINMAGISPLRGQNIDEMGPRFPSCSDIYTKAIRTQAMDAFKASGVDFQEGVYFYCQGPNYETPAEIRAFRILGADAVGMSTAPETLVACHCGMKVLGISCITNMAAGILDQPLNHEEVQETATMVKDQFIKVIKSCVKNIIWE